MSEYIPKVGHVVESIYTDNNYQPLKGVVTKVIDYTYSWVQLSDNDHPEFHANREMTYIPRHAFPYSYGQDDVSSWEYQYYSPKHRHANA